MPGEKTVSFYNCILCAIDLSEESDLIIKRSIRLANKNRDNLHLVHVCEHPITGYGELTDATHAITEVDIRHQALEKLKSLAADFHIPLSNTWVEFGAPVEAIRKCADKMAADIIVVGSHRKFGIKLLMGSKVEDLIKDTCCDILTIPFS